MITSVHFGRGPSSNFIFSSSWDSAIKVWQTERLQNEPVAVLNGHRSRVTDIDVTQDGQHFVSSSTDTTLLMWEATKPFNCIAVYRAPPTERGFNCVAAYKDLFITGSENGVVRVWPIATSSNYKSHFHKIEDHNK